MEPKQMMQNVSTASRILWFLTLYQRHTEVNATNMCGNASITFSYATVIETRN